MARIQNNLGEAYRNRIRGEKADNLEMAIDFYQASLLVYTRKAFPQEWAEAQNSLATSYRNRIRGEKADNLEKALTTLQATLSIYTARHFLKIGQ
jgi:hypothetical protein